MSRKKIPPEALISLRSSLESLPMRSPERKKLIEKTASLYCVSSPTVYRYLKEHSNLRPINRSDSGVPRVLSQKEMEYYCELIAAIKVGSTNKKSRHLLTLNMSFPCLWPGDGVMSNALRLKAPWSFLCDFLTSGYQCQFYNMSAYLQAGIRRGGCYMPPNPGKEPSSSRLLKYFERISEPYLKEMVIETAQRMLRADRNHRTKEENVMKTHHKNRPEKT